MLGLTIATVVSDKLLAEDRRFVVAQTVCHPED